MLGSPHVLILLPPPRSRYLDDSTQLSSALTTLLVEIGLTLQAAAPESRLSLSLAPPRDGPSQTLFVGDGLALALRFASDPLQGACLQTSGGDKASAASALHSAALERCTPRSVTLLALGAWPSPSAALSEALAACASREVPVSILHIALPAAGEEDAGVAGAFVRQVLRCATSAADAAVRAAAACKVVLSASTWVASPASMVALSKAWVSGRVPRPRVALTLCKGTVLPLELLPASAQGRAWGSATHAALQGGLQVCALLDIAALPMDYLLLGGSAPGAVLAGGGGPARSSRAEMVAMAVMAPLPPMLAPFPCGAPP